MATKPTDVTDWATNPGAVDEPSAGRKATGWAVSERPRARHVNWLFNIISGWIDYLRDNQFQSAGGAVPFTFDDDVNVSGETETDQLLVTQGAGFTDQSESTIRHYVDSNGYLSGLVVQYQLDWAPDGAFVSDAEPLQTAINPGKSGGSVISGLGIIQVQDPLVSGGLSCPFVRLINTAPAGAQMHVHADVAGSVAASKRGRIIGDLANSVVKMTWQASHFSPSDLARTVVLGLHSDHLAATPDDAATHDFLLFRYVDSNTNWEAISGDGTSSTVTDTGVAYSNGQIHVFQIEYHGSATPRGIANGNAAIVEFWIDGVSRAVHSTSLPVNFAVGPLIAINTTALGDGVDVGPIWISHNTQLASYRV